MEPSVSFMGAIMAPVHLAANLNVHPDEMRFLFPGKHLGVLRVLLAREEIRFADVRRRLPKNHPLHPFHFSGQRAQSGYEYSLAERIAKDITYGKQIIERVEYLLGSLDNFYLQQDNRIVGVCLSFLGECIEHITMHLNTLDLWITKHYLAVGDDSGNTPLTA